MRKDALHVLVPACLSSCGPTRPGTCVGGRIATRGRLINIFPAQIVVRPGRCHVPSVRQSPAGRSETRLGGFWEELSLDGASACP